MVWKSSHTRKSRSEHSQNDPGINDHGLRPRSAWAPLMAWCCTCFDRARSTMDSADVSMLPQSEGAEGSGELLEFAYSAAFSDRSG